MTSSDIDRVASYVAPSESVTTRSRGQKVCSFRRFKLQLAFFKASVKRNDKQADQIWPNRLILFMAKTNRCELSQAN